MTSNLREIASGLRFPEGPIALPDGSFLVVEIERRCLSRISPEGVVTPVAFTGGGPNGAALGPDGKCYICNNGGLDWVEDASGLRPLGMPADYRGGRIERIDLATGAVEVLYDRSEGGPLRAPNDLVFDRTGGFWFTDRGKTSARAMDFGGIYYARPDGSSIREVVFPFLSPNGIALSPDEDRLYVADTLGGRLWEFDIVGPGELARQPWPHSTHGGRLLMGSGNRFQLFDSMAVDSSGAVCVATIANGGITIAPADESPASFVAMPDTFTTNICFGGPDLRTAYITLSLTGKLVAVDWHCPGSPLNFLNR